MKTGVIQPLPGIGDMIWFLPALRAIAASTPDGKMTLLARSSAQASALFHAEPMIEGITSLPSKKRGLAGVVPNFFHTWQAIRRARPDRLYILHQSARYQLAARLAGVREIITYPSDLARSKDNGWKKSLSFLAQTGIEVTESLSRLTVSNDIKKTIELGFSQRPQPWIVIAPGASTEARRWPTDRFAACADALANSSKGTVFLIGSTREVEHIATIQNTCTNKDQIVPVVNLPFDQVMGLIANGAFLLGNDSGPANVAAALGIPAFLLCGTSTPPLHSPHLHLIMPDLPSDSAEGMQGISAAFVIEHIKKFLMRKNSVNLQTKI